jgi:hypothetical protein
MATQKLPEVWLRGPIENITPLLQPVAHCLLQAREEANELMKDFPVELDKTSGCGFSWFSFAAFKRSN